MSKSSLISNDMIEMVQSEMFEGTLKKINFSNYISIYVGKVRMSKKGKNSPSLFIGDGISGSYLDMWKQDVGKILFQELKKDEPLVYVLKTKRFSAILKLITDEEYESFKERELDHILFGDNRYTLIRVYGKDDSFSDPDNKNVYHSDAILFAEGNFDTIDDFEMKSYTLI